MVHWRPKSAKVYPIQLDCNILEFSVVKNNKGAHEFSSKVPHPIGLDGEGAGTGIGGTGGVQGGGKAAVPFARSHSCQMPLQSKIK